MADVLEGKLAEKIEEDKIQEFSLINEFTYVCDRVLTEWELHGSLTDTARLLRKILNRAEKRNN